MEQQLSKFTDELLGINQRLDDPGIYSSKDYPKLAKRKNELETIIGLLEEKLHLEDSIKQAEIIIDSDDTELAGLAQDEISSLKKILRISIRSYNLR